jgi:hypothetical protein
MSIPAAWPQVLDFFGTPLAIEPSPGQLSGDAWLPPISQFDERAALTRAFGPSNHDVDRGSSAPDAPSSSAATTGAAAPWPGDACRPLPAAVPTRGPPTIR